MEPLLSLPADQFRAALAELQLDPQREADLVRQYRRANSPLAPLFGLLDRVAADDAGEGMQRASMVPVARPEGMSVAEAVRSGRAQFAVPRGVFDAIGALAGGIDAPGAAARGLIPAQDMPAEALGTAGVAMGAGGLLSRPAGSVGMGGRVARDARASDWIDDLRSRYPGAQIDVSGGPGRGYTVSRIVVPESDRSQGVGTQIMREITEIADSQNATVALTPSSDFGGSASRLRDFYGRLGFVSNTGRNRDMSISEEMYREPISANRSTTAGLLASAAETPAQRVAGLLREGRASEVTDDLMAQVDPQEMYRLYVSGETGMDLPMDEASRMARAREMFPDTAYHSTGVDFQRFVPSEFRGASFFGSTPEGATRGASASANEGVGSGSTITMPVRVNTRNVEGLGAYGRRDMNEFAASLPNRLYTEAEVDALMASEIAPAYGDWSYFFDDLTDYEALRNFREANPSAKIPEGIIQFRPKQPLSYVPGLRSDISGRQFAHYSEGMSERPISEHTREIGNTGFTMMDESGLALAMTDPTQIRSRFARFDPRLSQLANLNAANVSPITGLLALMQAQEQQR